jgi:hypothetical protein
MDCQCGVRWVSWESSWAHPKGMGFSAWMRIGTSGQGDPVVYLAELGWEFLQNWGSYSKWYWLVAAHNTVCPVVADSINVKQHQPQNTNPRHRSHGIKLGRSKDIRCHLKSSSVPLFCAKPSP